MHKIGITGGIGSGKSLVSKMFSVLGIPVLNADDTAKCLMETDASLRQQLEAAFGTETYKNGRLNRPFLASAVFADPEQLGRLNAIVHPAVIAYANEWARRQTAPYVIKEAALFFESGSWREMDKIIGVSAPEALRIERAMRRDQSSEKAVRERMSRQMDESEKMARCDYIIHNDETASVIKQVTALHEQLLTL